MDYDEIVTTPGKFEGCRKAVEEAYKKSLEGFQDDDFGSVQEYGYYCRVYLEGLDEPVCFMEDEYGFIHEISNEEYEAMKDKYDDFFAEDEEE